MRCALHFVFLLIASSIPIVISSLKLQVDGRMDFGPKWNYEYRIKPFETSSMRSVVTEINAGNTDEEENENEEPAGAKLIDIIIKNNKSNPRLVQVAEARIYDRDILRQGNQTTQIEDKSVEDNKDSDTEESLENQNLSFDEFITETDIPITVTEESTTTTEAATISAETETTKKQITTKQPAKKLQFILSEESEEFTETPLIISEERSNLGAINGATVVWPNPKKIKRGPNGKKKNSTVKANLLRENNINIELNISTINSNITKPPPPIKDKHRNKGKRKGKTDVKLAQNNTSNTNITENRIEVEEFLSQVTRMIEIPEMTEMFVKPHYVRDDPKIKEFTKHIYEQSIRTFESIKEKLNNYEFKKEADYLMRGYEEKFGDFVRETQNQMIRTRLGNEKVILNTVDTSNRILDRLVNYLISKMDKRGYLRNAGAENVILKELDKKKELENKHICNKMNICRSKDSLTNFLIDILTIILSADDKKVIQMRDAVTEVVKNTDFSLYLDPDTERRFQKGISDIEIYDIKLIRPIFGMFKNILASRNTPIKVVGPEDSRVNKTVAFMEMINNFDKKLPPNDKNVLEWNDMRNSFKEWKDGKRKDSAELIQHLADHLLSPGLKINAGRVFDRNINAILGF